TPVVSFFVETCENEISGLIATEAVGCHSTPMLLPITTPKFLVSCAKAVLAIEIAHTNNMMTRSRLTSPPTGCWRLLNTCESGGTFQDRQSSRRRTELCVRGTRLERFT